MIGSIAQWVQDQVAANGLQAIFVLMVLESTCVPIPSEVTMIYAGYLVSQGDLVFWQAVLVGAFANLVVVDRLECRFLWRRLRAASLGSRAEASGAG